MTRLASVSRCTRAQSRKALARRAWVLARTDRQIANPVGRADDDGRDLPAESDGTPEGGYSALILPSYVWMSSARPRFEVECPVVSRASLLSSTGCPRLGWLRKPAKGSEVLPEVCGFDSTTWPLTYEAGMKDAPQVQFAGR